MGELGFRTTDQAVTVGTLQVREPWRQELGQAAHMAPEVVNDHATGSGAGEPSPKVLNKGWGAAAMRRGTEAHSQRTECFFHGS